jgi:hypothetical protein
LLAQCELLLRPTLINIGLEADGGVDSGGWLAAESPPPPPVPAVRNALVRNKSSLLAFLCPLTYVMLIKNCIRVVTLQLQKLVYANF